MNKTSISILCRNRLARGGRVLILAVALISQYGFSAYAYAGGNDSPVTQQTAKKISGTVKDVNGEPLMGASVVAQGTSNGTVTDLDGNFTLSVEEGRNLVVSFIGFTSQTVKATAVMNITLLEDSKLIGEVVVVGYATVKKANLTGAVDQVRGDVLENRPVVSVGQALQGTIANLNISPSLTGGSGSNNRGGAPGAGMSINIRGVSGLEGSGTDKSVAASPLIVIDGIQGGDINAVNPEDIESISVLKDAASAAIYGSSAPYGVILITTKKGGKNAKPTITYGGNMGWSTPINLPKSVNSVEFAHVYNEAYVNAGASELFSKELIQRMQDYMDGKITDETSANKASNRWHAWEMGNANNEWFKIYFKEMAFSQQHNLGVSGGTDKSSYYFGLGYNQKDGMYRYGEDTYNRYNIRANLSSTLNSWLTANVRTAFTRGVMDTPDTYGGKMGDNGYMHNIARKWPNVPLRNPDGYFSDASEVGLQLEGGRDHTTNDVLALTGEFVLNPLPGWNATVNYSFNLNNTDQQENRWGVLDHYPDGGSGFIGGTTPDYLYRKNINNESHIINAFTSYEIDGGDHYFKVLAGFAQELYKDHFISASNNNLYTNTVPSLSTTYGSNPGIGENKSTLSSRGIFGRVNYGYKEKYLVELNGRYDGTSRFLSDVRFKFYPGASAAWVVSNEGFWESLNGKVDLLKIRASYGSLGDQTTINKRYPFYPSLVARSSTSSDSKWIFGNGRQPYISYPELVNPDLTWVTTTTIDFGFDFALLKNRLSATFDWYKRTSDDMIGPSEALPAVLGVSAPSSNNASLETKGFELTLGWRDRVGAFNYGVRATLSDSRTFVMKYPNPNKLITQWYDGAEVGNIWGYVTEGYYTKDETIDQDRQKYLFGTWTAGDIKYADLNGDGKIDIGKGTVDEPGDRKIIGNRSPRYVYGITLEADYRGFDVNVFLQGVGKRDAYFADNNNYFWGIVGDEWQSSYFTTNRDRWTESNPTGYFPKYYMSSQNKKNLQAQTKYLQNAAYMRLKNMQIGYTIPKHILAKASIAKLRVYVSGENLVTLTKMINTIDPEYAGTDNKIYPQQATWSFGLNLTF